MEVMACLLVACVSVVRGAMILTSPKFEKMEEVPPKYGCDAVEGRNHLVPSPPLEWTRVPAKTRSFVLMVDDFDDVGFVHWLVKDIPADVLKLDEDVSGLAMPEGAEEMLNSWREPMYGGMCPPPNSKHLYRFRLYARRVEKSDTLKNPPPNGNRSMDVNAQLYDEMLRTDNDTLYCAVLPGYFPVGDIRVSKEVASTVATMPGGPKHVERYRKPSEAGEQKRAHYNPRPVDSMHPYNGTHLCRRTRPASMSAKDYAQLCDTTPPWQLAMRTPEQVEAGGTEEAEYVPPLVVPTGYRPTLRADGKPRTVPIPSNGIDRTFFDMRRLQYGSCQTHDGSYVPNNYRGPDTGDNSCNSCNCTDFTYKCETKDCSDPNAGVAVETVKRSVDSAHGGTTDTEDQKVVTAADMAMSPEEKAAKEAEEEFNRMVASLAKKQGKTEEQVREQLATKLSKIGPKEEKEQMIDWKWGKPPSSSTNANSNANSNVALLELKDEDEDGSSPEAAMMIKALMGESSQAKEFLAEHPEMQPPPFSPSIDDDLDDDKDTSNGEKRDDRGVEDLGDVNAALERAKAESDKEARAFQSNQALTPPGMAGGM